MAALIDTSFLVALASVRDMNHQRSVRAFNEMSQGTVIPAPVLPEMFYMLVTRVNYDTAIRMFKMLRNGQYQIEPLTNDDMNRMQDIMEQYVDNAFDYVDTAIMSLAERLNVANIYSFDHVDFNVFRPLHRPYLRVLP